MQSYEPPQIIVLVGAQRPEPEIEREMEARGIGVRWARSIKMADGLLNSTHESAVVITEAALVDGNWRDLVERISRLGRPIPILLVAPASTAELWWDALECGVEEILPAPVSASQLRQFLKTWFPGQK
jgi:DNA-binding NtrC family response regulator